MIHPTDRKTIRFRIFIILIVWWQPPWRFVASSAKRRSESRNEEKYTAFRIQEIMFLSRTSKDCWIIDYIVPRFSNENAVKTVKMTVLINSPA
jgi:hypothetical protein